MADSTTPLDTITEAQANKAAGANALFDAASHPMTFGRRASTTAGLTWGYYGGRIAGVSVTGSTVTLTASTTNFVVVHRTTLVVSVAVDGANWCTPETYARLYKIVCGTSGPTSYEDHRTGKWGIFVARTALEAERLELWMPDGGPATSLTAATKKAVRRSPSQALLTGFQANVATVSSSGAPSFDFNNNGVSCLATNITIDQSEKSNATANAAHVFCDFGDVVDTDDELSWDCDSAGTSAAGAAITPIGIRNCGDRHRDLCVLLLTGQGSNNGTVFTDSSPAARTATRVGNVITSTGISDPWGGSLSSLYFDGTTDGLQLAYADDLNFNGAVFTLRGRFYVTATTNNRALFDFRGTASNTSSWIAYINAASRYVSIFDGPTNSNIVTSSNNVIPAANTWFDYELSRNSSGTVRIRIDGTSVASVTYNPPATHSSGVNICYRMGTADTETYQGYARDVAFYKHIERHTANFTVSRRAHPTF